MGLDQFAYTVDSNNNKVQIAYWRKHPNLQGWMEKLWESKGSPGKSEEPSPFGSDFNCIPIELTSEDITNLEHAVTNHELPSTVGFFFGDDGDDYYYDSDLDFIRQAKNAIDNGLTVCYDSSW